MDDENALMASLGLSCIVYSSDEEEEKPLDLSLSKSADEGPEYVSEEIVTVEGSDQAETDRTFSEKDTSTVNIVVGEDGEIAIICNDNIETPFVIEQENEKRNSIAPPLELEQTGDNELNTLDTALELEPKEDENNNIKGRNPSPVNSNNKCEICGKNFTRRHGLKRHLKVHSTGEKCAICGKTSFDIQRHMKIHGDQELLPCEVCGKGFNSKNGLKNHLSVHAGEYRLICSYCGKGFNYQHDLEGHQTIHTGVKLNKCKKCGKEYTYGNYYNTHVKACGNLKCFRCETCKKQFKQKRYLSDHMKAHDNPERFQCSGCGLLFKYRSSLYKHKKVTGH